ENAQRCFQRAVKLGPNSAGILLSAGDFYLQSGDQERGLRCLSRTLALTSDNDEAIFSYYSERQVQFERILQHGLPIIARVAASYLHYLMQRPAAADATNLWKWMVQHSLT